VNNLHIISLYKLHDKVASRSCRARRVEPCCSTSSTQPKCMGSTRRTCRDVTSQVEFVLYCFILITSLTVRV